ncbi:MAG: nitrile hydratase subunit alpha [Acidimicrobiales bacterium]
MRALDDPGSAADPAGDHHHDLDAQLGALESDLEYFRVKRLEPRLLHLLRRGVLSFAGLVRAGSTLGVDGPPLAAEGTVEQRVRVLQDALDVYVTGIATLTLPLRTVQLVVDDTRRERGDYDPFFRLAKRPHSGLPADRMARLGAELGEGLAMVEVATAALIAAGETDEESLAARRAALARQGYRNGARIVARAWVDPDFARQLVDTGREALREMDVPPGRLGRLGVAVNTEERHHVVVCTLCSCYPHDLLGDPPWWYRSDEYKSRIVDDPRAALHDLFGLDVPAARTVRVHDSTSDLRWMVVPRRPAGTEGWEEQDLAALVTPESLVGVADVEGPA